MNRQAAAGVNIPTISCWDMQGSRESGIWKSLWLMEDVRNPGFVAHLRRGRSPTVLATVTAWGETRFAMVFRSMDTVNATVLDLCWVVMVVGVVRVDRVVGVVRGVGVLGGIRRGVHGDAYC